MTELAETVMERRGFFGRLDNADGVSWLRTWRFWRVQVGWRAWRHTYANPTVPDRWVVHPMFVYDRKAKP